MARVALVVVVLAVIGAALWYWRSDDVPVVTAPTGAAATPSPRAPSTPLPQESVLTLPRPPNLPAPPQGPPQDDPVLLAQIGRTRLEQGLDAKNGGRVEQARALLEEAVSALAKSIALSGEHADPWTLQSMAHAQLELGHNVEAVSWADRALQQLRLGSGDDYTQFRAAQLTMMVGIVYYRAGQQQTGIAYMDQAISLAPTDFDREDFKDLKEETIGG